MHRDLADVPDDAGVAERERLRHAVGEVEPGDPVAAAAAAGGEQRDEGEQAGGAHPDTVAARARRRNADPATRCSGSANPLTRRPAAAATVAAKGEEMRRCTIVPLAALALLAASCGGSGSSGLEGSGVAATSTRDVSSFTAVELRGTGTVEVRRGSPAKVTVRGDDNIVPLVTTEVEGSTLVVDEKEGNFSTKQPLVVEVVAPELSSSVLSGAGTLHVAEATGPSFDAQLSGTGKLDVDGTVDTLNATVSGAGSAQLEHLVTRNAVAGVSGVGSVHVYATDTVDASVSGAGSVLYGGHPAKVTTNVSGVGSVAAAD